MPKTGVLCRARPRKGRRELAELPNAVEGQIEEICRDLAVQAKRLRQLQQDAEALRAVIRQWAGQSEANP